LIWLFLDRSIPLIPTTRILKDVVRTTLAAHQICAARFLKRFPGLPSAAIAGWVATPGALHFRFTSHQAPSSLMFLRIIFFAGCALRIDRGMPAETGHSEHIRPSKSSRQATNNELNNFRISRR
jgi:hypothetical protein